jgi:hypothetical protein
VLAPLNVVVESLEKMTAASEPRRRRSRRASAAFKQSAELPELQAATLQRATQALRDPADFVRSAGGMIKREE